MKECQLINCLYFSSGKNEPILEGEPPANVISTTPVEDGLLQDDKSSNNINSVSIWKDCGG